VRRGEERRRSTRRGEERRGEEEIYEERRGEEDGDILESHQASCSMLERRD